jgi:hypothetical protein
MFVQTTQGSTEQVKSAPENRGAVKGRDRPTRRDRRSGVLGSREYAGIAMVKGW